MTTNPQPMSDATFYGYMHPLQNRRYYLALVLSILLFPVIALALIAGMIFMIVPAVAFLLWMGMRIFFAHMLGNSILVSAENYPRIHTITAEVKAKLGYSKRVYVFVYEDGSFNASMRYIFFRRAIFLNSELLRSGVSDSEVRWLVGRFVGYMRARQQAGALGWVIRAAQHLLVFNFFIMPYERALVSTGDRLALAEIDGDLTSAISAMQKLLVGRDLGYSVNPEGFIAQHRQVKGSFFGFLARAAGGFPHTTARYVDLILFTKAFFPSQFAVFHAANPGLPEDIGQLGISQQTETGVAIPARAPRAWTYAGATMAVLVAAFGFLVWINIPSESFAYDPYSPPPAIEEELLVIEPPPPPPTPPPAETTTEPSVSPVEAGESGPPPNTHFTATGVVEPNEGCRWMTDQPDDLRVICEP